MSWFVEIIQPLMRQASAGIQSVKKLKTSAMNSLFNLQNRITNQSRQQ
ncbi:hypothetical protein CEV32_2320 [Brucella rhizosphaerae]|uniref:Uncharacterized protein n=1 Tax=Brucella rhizosphaerae TaxID=571254 RepID=A0A256F4W2_9HYPH|nr:hypothetical protein CEV32_2320 [Brucella rhizosphaerae]